MSNVEAGKHMQVNDKKLVKYNFLRNKLITARVTFTSIDAGQTFFGYRASTQLHKPNVRVKAT